MKSFKQFLKEMNYGSLIDRDKYNDLDDADRALYRYTADGFTYLDSHIDELQHRYPFEGGVLYRGLHFDTKEQHDAFLKELEDGKLKLNGSTSWTPDVGTANEFARTKKSYFPTPELLKASRDISDAGDYMNGYGGVILKTKVPRNVGCDVSKSDFAKESEVLLPPDTYEVEVEKLLAPYRRQYDTPEKVNDIIERLKNAKEKDRELNGLATYVYNSWRDKLSPEQTDSYISYYNRGVFEKTTKEIAERCVSLKIDKISWRREKTKELSLGIYSPFDYNLYKNATAKTQKKIDSYVSAIAKYAKTSVAELVDSGALDEVSEFDIRGLDSIRDFVNVDVITRPLKMHLGKKYHEMNSREVNKTLRTYDDIKAHGEKVSKVIDAIAKLG